MLLTNERSFHPSVEERRIGSPDLGESPAVGISRASEAVALPKVGYASVLVWEESPLAYEQSPLAYEQSPLAYEQSPQASEESPGCTYDGCPGCQTDDHRGQTVDAQGSHVH